MAFLSGINSSYRFSRTRVDEINITSSALGEVCHVRVEVCHVRVEVCHVRVEALINIAKEYTLEDKQRRGRYYKVTVLPIVRERRLLVCVYADGVHSVLTVCTLHTQQVPLQALQCTWQTPCSKVWFRKRNSSLQLQGFGARFQTELCTRGCHLDPTHVRFKRTCV
jgi:hypothetical protein